MDGKAVNAQAIVNRRLSPPDRPLTLMPPGNGPPTYVKVSTLGLGIMLKHDITWSHYARLTKQILHRGLGQYSVAHGVCSMATRRLAAECPSDTAIDSQHGGTCVFLDFARPMARSTSSTIEERLAAVVDLPRRKAA